MGSASLLKHLGSLPDSRAEENRKHLLVDVVAIAVCGVLVGCDGPTSIRLTDHVPSRLIYDKAADSDPLRERLAKRGVDLVCPHHKNRVKKPTQDGRKLRRYKRRWKIERTIAWLHNFRRCGSV